METFAERGGQLVVHGAAVSDLDWFSRTFDRAFMESTFDSCWSHAQHATKWTNTMLAPPPEHVLNLIGAGGSFQAVADRFANGFDILAGYAQWLFEPPLAEAYPGRVAKPWDRLNSEFCPFREPLVDALREFLREYP